MNNTNNSSSTINNQKEFETSTNQTTNIMSPSQNSVNNQETGVHNFDDAFINRGITNNNEENIVQNSNNFINEPVGNQMNNPFENQTMISVIPNMEIDEKNKNDDEINPLLASQQNKFINNNIDTTNTSLNNLNIDSNYNNMQKIDYSKDPKVQENIKKRNTVTITGEGKIFIIIIVILLLFIFALPTVFDYIRNITY